MSRYLSTAVHRSFPIMRLKTHSYRGMVNVIRRYCRVFGEFGVFVNSSFAYLSVPQHAGETFKNTPAYQHR